MSSAIVKVFEQTNTEVSFWVDETGEDLMQAKGIFEALELGVTNISVTLERHVDFDYRRQVAIGRGMPAWYITYEGLIQLAFATKAPRAKALQRWVSKVIKTIIKTGQYVATATDQQHFSPFGMTLQLKIEECDRALPGAAVGTGDVRKILADRDALEQAYKRQPKQVVDALLEPVRAHLAQCKEVRLVDVVQALGLDPDSMSDQRRIGKIMAAIDWEKKRVMAGSSRITCWVKSEVL
jgi:prophage antirepressor-like protein